MNIPKFVGAMALGLLLVHCVSFGANLKFSEEFRTESGLIRKDLDSLEVLVVQEKTRPTRCGFVGGSFGSA